MRGFHKVFRKRPWYTVRSTFDAQYRSAKAEKDRQGLKKYSCYVTDSEDADSDREIDRLKQGAEQDERYEKESRTEREDSQGERQIRNCQPIKSFELKASHIPTKERCINSHNVPEATNPQVLVPRWSLTIQRKHRFRLRRIRLGSKPGQKTTTSSLQDSQPVRL